MNNDTNKGPYSSVQLNDNEPTESPKDIVENAFQEQEDKIKEYEEERELEETLKKLSIQQIKAAEEEEKRKEQEEKEVEQKKGPRPRSPFTIYSNIVEKVDNNETIQTSIKYITRLRKRTKVLLLVLFIVIFSSILLYKYNKDFRNNPSEITKSAFVSVGKETLKIIRIPEDQTLVGDTFSIDGKATYQLQSDRVMENYMTDQEMLKNYYLINNLNKATTTYSIKQDKNKKKFLYSQSTSINNKVVTEEKYLIENSTEYYFVKEFMTKYINNGNKTYFESLTRDRNANDNILYLYKLIISSIPENINSNDYKTKNTTTIIDGKSEKVTQISVSLNHKKMIELSKRILEVLKKDKRAFNILQGAYDDFENYKIKNDWKYLENTKKVELEVYTQGFFRNTKKMVIEITDNNGIKGFQFESDYNRIIYLENKTPKFYFEYETKRDKVNIVIRDNHQEKVGKIELDYDKSNPRYQMNYDDSTYKIVIDFNNKITKKTRESYNSKISLDIDIRKDKKTILKGTIDLQSKVTNKPKIEEEITDIIFERDLTDEQKDELKNLQKNRLQTAL